MQAIDVLLRAGGGALLMAVALLLIRDARRSRIAWLFLLFALGLCGFLARNTPDESLMLSGAPAAVASLLSGNAAVFLWWFALAVFDDEFRLDRFKLGVGGCWFVIALVDRGLLGEGDAPFNLSWVLLAIGAGMVGHLGYRLLRDREGDLIEARRRARSALAAGLGALLLVDIGVDLLLGFDWKPHGFTLAQNTAVVLFGAVMAGVLLRADAAGLAFRPALAAGAAKAAPVPVPRQGSAEPNAPLLRRLTALMEIERVYRDPDLTVAGFAARMGAPEPEVRRLVNQHLGHGHFRSFLNAHRVAEACRILADPARADDKMVAVAFDVGFASLASFNRAFKLAEGRSPSEFRSQARAPAEASPAPGALSV